MHLRLYTTLGCHLCSALEVWLGRLVNEPVTLERIEISDDDALMHRYGVRIPVLMDEQGNELERGFEPERLAQWLAARGWLDNAAWQQADQAALGVEAGAVKSHKAVIRQGRRYLR